MLLKLSWYQFKLDCYRFSMLIVIPMIMTKRINLRYTEKEMSKESKWNTRKK